MTELSNEQTDLLAEASAFIEKNERLFPLKQILFSV